MSRRGRTRAARAARALATGLAVACSPVEPDPWALRAAALDAARARWADADLSAYRLTSTTGCECYAGFVGPVEITVRDGEIVGVAPVLAGETVETEMWPAFLAVEEMFDRVDTAIRDEAYAFRVEYDAGLGHPTSIGLDLDRRMVDDELYVVVEALEALGPDGP